MFKIKKPKKCAWISDESWETLTLKEKDYVIFLHEREYSKEKIMRKLYLEDRTSYWRLQNRVKNKIKTDVEKYNRYIEKVSKKLKKL